MPHKKPVPISAHIFIFPFLIQKEVEAFSQRLRNDWEEFRFNPAENVTHYNQHSYFYDFVEEALWEQGGKKGKALVKVYQYAKITESSVYSVAVQTDREQYNYKLGLEKITLKVYGNFEIGTLSFHVNNFEYRDEHDVLRINDFGRRLYPQFLSETNYVKATKNSFLANEIALRNLLIPDIIEDFSAFESPPFKESYLPKHITELIGKHVKEVLDDRMFVCCFYGNPEISKILKQAQLPGNGSGGVSYGYLEDGFWYQFIFVDSGGPTCQSKNMMTGFLKEATNERWIDFGTLYGVSRYSFMVLSDGGFFSKNIIDHLNNMYAEMATLCLVQRATLLNFAHRITKISTKSINSKEVSQLYQEYIEFRNRIYFREVTAQEQGIELYDLLQKQMRLEKEMKDLDDEFSELNSYVQGKDQDKLTKVATYFLPPTLIAGIIAFFSDKSYFQFDKISLAHEPNYQNITLRYLTLLLCVALGFLIGHLILRRKSKHN